MSEKFRPPTILWRGTLLLLGPPDHRVGRVGVFNVTSPGVLRRHCDQHEFTPLLQEREGKSKLNFFMLNYQV